MTFKKIDLNAELNKQLIDLRFKESFDRVQLQYELIEQIAFVRKSKSITQARLAELTGVSQQAISRLEKEKHLPNLDTLIKIVDGLGMKLTITER